jgi:hypothetical protein
MLKQNGNLGPIFKLRDDNVLRRDWIHHFTYYSTMPLYKYTKMGKEQMIIPPAVRGVLLSLATGVDYAACR